MDEQCNGINQAANNSYYLGKVSPSPHQHGDGELTEGFKVQVKT